MYSSGGKDKLRKEFERQASSFPVQVVRDLLETMVFKTYFERKSRFGYASDNYTLGQYELNNTVPGPGTVSVTEDNSGGEQRWPLCLRNV